jgi:hypothetical protein
VIAATSSKPDPADRSEDIKSHRALIRSVGEKTGLTRYQMFQRDEAFRNAYAVSLAKAQAQTGNVDQVIADLDAAQQRKAQDRVLEEQGTEAERRKLPITAELKRQLNNAATQVGLQVQVWSGGQPGEDEGRPLERTGGPRHDDGTAADVRLFELVDGKRRYLSSGNRQDREKMAAFITHAVAAGATGVGHASDYMGLETIHVGGGEPLVWGKDGLSRHKVGWVQAAYDRGLKARTGIFLPTPKPTPDGAAITEQRALTVFDAMGGPEREALRKHMYEVRDSQRRDAVAAALKSSGERRAEYEQRMHDATIGKAALPSPEEIDADAALDPLHREQIRRQLDIAAKDTASFNVAFERFRNNESFDPNDVEDRKNADRIFQNRDGDDATLTAIIERTGILPASAAVRMRGDLLSNDPERLMAAMTRADKAIRINPNVLDRVEGGAELERGVVKFRALRDTLGMTAEEAANRIVRERTHELQSEPEREDQK